MTTFAATSDIPSAPIESFESALYCDGKDTGEVFTKTMFSVLLHPLFIPDFPKASSRTPETVPTTPGSAVSVYTLDKNEVNSLGVNL